MNLPRITCRAVVYQDNQFLLQRGDDEKFWNLPGGGYEKSDSSTRECLKREMMEETGVDVDVGRLLFVQELHSTEMVKLELFFLVTPQDKSQFAQTNSDTDNAEKIFELKWFDITSLEGLDVRPLFFRDNIEKLLNLDQEIFHIENPASKK